MIAAAAASLAPGGLASLAAATGPGGAGLTVDRADGAGGGRRPGVILIHGADGLSQRQNYLMASSALSAQGFTVLFPHYFARQPNPGSYEAIEAGFPAWLRALGDVVDTAARDPAIEPGRLALVGISLGGTLALSLAARDRRIRAVVSYFGFAPRDLPPAPAQAPTLILHGRADRVVPVRNADAIEKLLRARGADVEKQIYDGEGHGFSRSAQLDAAMRTASFLQRHLAS